MKKLVLLLFFSAIVVAACKKDEPLPLPATNTELLAKTWKPDTLLINGVNLTAFFQSTRITFSAGGTYILFDPAESDTGTWVFANNETQIILDPGDDQQVWQLIALNSQLLKIRTEDDGDVIDASWSPVQ
jgi:hypothetical protein